MHEDAIVMNQLTLGISLRDDATFDNFFPGRNDALIPYLQLFASRAPERMLYLWGESGSGLSHLLQACCHQHSSLGNSCLYLPLAQAKELTPEVLNGLEDLTLLVIDDIDAIAGQHAWEEALFHLYNRILVQQTTSVIFAAHRAPKQLPVVLPDLQSRLSSLLALYIQPLEDAEKLAALQMRAQGRGLVLSKQVGQFLLRRCARQMSVLFIILERLDQASMAAQRKLTIPFVKSVLQL
jgi:DnaA family protein